MMNDSLYLEDSFDIAMMEANAEYQHRMNTLGISFFESGDENAYYESVIDTVKDAIKKIYEKFKEMIKDVKKKITQKIAEYNFSKDAKKIQKESIKYANVLSGFDITSADPKKLESMYRDITKEYTDIFNSAIKLDTSKTSYPDDLKKVYDKMYIIDEKLSSKYADDIGSATEYTVNLITSISSVSPSEYMKFITVIENFDESMYEKANNEIDKIETGGLNSNLVQEKINLIRMLYSKCTSMMTRIASYVSRKTMQLINTVHEIANKIEKKKETSAND